MDLADLLADNTPVASSRLSWMDGAMPLRLDAHLGDALPPDELIVSVRCIVRVGDQVVLVENSGGVRHVVPGGHRNPGETYADTALREVYEETGWSVDPKSLRQLGWLHFAQLGPLPPGSYEPHPDFVHLMLTGTGTRRDSANWSDTEGEEISSWLVPVDEARRESANELHDRLFLDLI
jgi:ADP-ribose pyrophosphatase YjhB (NUDIX family)